MDESIQEAFSLACPKLLRSQDHLCEFPHETFRRQYIGGDGALVLLLGGSNSISLSSVDVLVVQCPVIIHRSKFGRILLE